MFTKTGKLLEAFSFGETITIDEEFVNDIKNNVDMFINDELIKTVEHNALCVICGESTSLYVIVDDDDGTAMCLNCCIGESLDGSIMSICSNVKANKKEHLKMMKSF